MLSIEEKCLIVLCEGWKLLPPIKKQAVISCIKIVDLLEKHGSFDPDDCSISLNERLFYGDSFSMKKYDIEGNDPPIRFPCVFRALATWLHEAAHAIGYATGLDNTDEWIDICGFVNDPETDPVGTSRYIETRVGWEYGASEWRYPTNGWFPRPYSTKNPAECFADCVTHLALGWVPFGSSDAARQKLRYLRRMLCDETGSRYLAASVQRIQTQVQHRLRGGARKG